MGGKLRVMHLNRRKEQACVCLALVTSLVPSAPVSLIFSPLLQEFYDSFIASALEEVHSDYVYAMKKAMLDYIISSALERQRLFLAALEPVLRPPRSLTPGHAALLARQLPPDWQAHVGMAREEIAWTLQTLSPNALELSKLWHDAGYAASKLIDVESADFKAHLPVQVRWYMPTLARCICAI